MTAAQAAGGPHDHLVTFSVTTGSLWLRVLLVAGLLLVAAFALLRPFLTEQPRLAVELVTWAAAGAGLLGLLLTEGIDLPQQVALLLLIALAVPVTVTRARQPRLLAVTRHVRGVAPWVLALALVASGVEFGRAWLGGTDAAPVLLHTGLVIALVGLSWFTICRPRTRLATISVQTLVWVLATAVVAGTAHVAVLSSAG
ncbi:DUF6239 family natural product biosynthesis protein [Amycolatopsis antarctica]|nr:DUF6239 family natural product biosynthesis protein [Amycolatopsis antarctica]